MVGSPPVLLDIDRPIANDPMASLARFLQDQFAAECPKGWRVSREGPLIPRELALFLGYAPRSDVVLERRDGTRRLWIEFEVSRADPVANHAKFATLHLFEPQPSTDVFLAMVSSHVVRGRRNLAANTIKLMRCIGMNAFQTVLLPQLAPDEITYLNHSGPDVIGAWDLQISREVERALAISEPVLSEPGRQVHFASDIVDVLSNLRGWNEEMRTATGRGLWGRRTVTYFVFDRRSASFAPSKFCAYVTIPEPRRPESTSREPRGAGMTVELYARLDASAAGFDGARARRHLAEGLGMSALNAEQAPEVWDRFTAWLCQHDSEIGVHPNGPIFLCPRPWQD
jgi:hypothetical protein